MGWTPDISGGSTFCPCQKRYPLYRRNSRWLSFALSSFGVRVLESKIGEAIVIVGARQFCPNDEM